MADDCCCDARRTPDSCESNSAMGSIFSLADEKMAPPPIAAALMADEVDVTLAERC